jgi:hypothetical protein
MSELVIDPTFGQYLSGTFDTTNIDPLGVNETDLENHIIKLFHDATGKGYVEFSVGFGSRKTEDPDARPLANFILNQLPVELRHPTVVDQIDLRTFTNYLEKNPQAVPDASNYVIDNKLTSRLTNYYASTQVAAFDSVATDRSDDELRDAIINDTSVGTIPETITFQPIKDPAELRAEVFGQEVPQDNDVEEVPRRTATLSEFKQNTNAALGGNLPLSDSQVSAEDLETIFGFDDTFASAANIFNDYQLQAILGADDGAVEIYKFRWNEDPPPGLGGRGVTFNLLQLRKQLRSMDPKYVAALSDKLAIAGYYERVGAQGPQIDGNGSDVIFQRAVSELVYDSVAAGGEALNSVLSRQLNQRLNNVNEQFKSASLSGLQQNIMQLGTYVLGRPLTPQQAMEAIRTLPEFQTGFVEEQLAAGVAPDVITAGAQELDETEQQQLLRYVYDANRREAQRFGANNWAGMFAQEAQRRISGVQSPQEVPFGAGEGTRPQNISAGDVMGDSNG